jgi:uncharacterized protein
MAATCPEPSFCRIRPGTGRNDASTDLASRSTIRKNIQENQIDKSSQQNGSSIAPRATMISRQERARGFDDSIGRLALVDALRGFALAGVLLVNLGGFSLYYFMDDAQRAALPTAGFDAWAGMAVQIFVQDKAITLFSLLFGLGMAMQVERAEAQGSGAGPILRRLTVLFAIGLVHAHLLWWGDILTIYAAMAFALICVRRLPDAVLLIAGLGLALFWFLLAPLAESLKPEDFPEQAQIYSATLSVFNEGDPAAALRQNVALAHWMWLEMWGVLPFVFARFLLGYWAGRKRLLQDPSANRGLLRAIFIVGGSVGLAAAIAVEWIESAQLTQSMLQDSRISEFALRSLRRIGPLGMGLAYAAGFALLYMRAGWRRWLRLLTPVGRMALSNYLIQTVVCLWLFYGIGLGVGSSGGYATRLLVWALLFGAQMAFSHWWLARFRLGPLEWLWRSLAEGRRLPMRAGNAA